MNGSNFTGDTSASVLSQQCTAAVKNLSTDFLHVNILWICDDYDAGSRGWHALFCSPFWGYGSMKLMLLFFALFCLRLYARQQAQTWQLVSVPGEDQKGRSGLYQRFFTRTDLGDSVPIDAFISRGRSATKRREIGSPTGGSPREIPRREHKPHISVMKKTLSCSFTIISRIVLQVLQWWVFMIFVLVLLLVLELYDVQRRYHILDADWHIQKPHQFHDIPDSLASFSIYSFGAVAFSYCISIVCILLQVLTHATETIFGRCQLCRAGAGIISLPRDVAIQVLLLPMVYAFLSSKSVICMWSIMTQDFDPALDCPRWDVKARAMVPRSTEDKITLQKLVFSSNFALADMYEAWALFCFGRMVAQVMQPELRKKIKMDVVNAFEILLLVDVTVFVGVCVVGAAYQILLTWFQWRLGRNVCESSPAFCSLSPYITGANWCVSSIAIYNLFTIETKFHHLDIMEKFKPRLKFWSIKLMVLVAFWASFLMAFIRDAWGLTENQSQLLDASVRCYVMGIVSILNIKAWYPWAKWYRHVLDDQFGNQGKGKDKPGSVMRDIGVKNVPQGTLLLVQKLFPSLAGDKNAEEWPLVEEAINKLDADQIDSVLWKGSQHGWVVPTDLDGGKRGKKRSALYDLGTEDKKKALKEHLLSLYPDV
eukprot:TRINITY_DN8721_c0_g2_i1.p1 TRINITY_DN8721_c0_g2~~TRINITY_DN8721_c0_g2_i1.p1  ORF type:complete len:652 (+),score=76.48 TRINITY_DN8721_c0_g2_i1:235-2190(+)